ncbi:MAG: mobile mystery protein A [Saprospiraceae bacterium]
MKKQQKKLLLAQIDKKIATFSQLKASSPPNAGWVNAIRVALGMSLKQLGKKLNISPQGAKDIERREKDGSITINALRETAAALDMQLVYGFLPRGETLQKTIEKRASQMATEIVMRTSQSMHLEDQAVSKEELKRAIDEKTQQIINEMPKYLWD